MRWKTDDYAGWGRVLTAQGKMARPERLDHLKACLKEAAGPAVGQLRSYGDAALNDGGAAINMARLNRLIEFDAATGILQAEAGVTIGEIARVFAPLGWILPVMPGTGFATLGGSIANDVHGKNHHVAGTFGQHVLSMDLIGANGRLRKLSLEATPDLFRATIGGLGQTGIIVSATLQLVRGASEIVDVHENRAENLDEFLAMLDRSTATYSVGWIDTTAKGDSLGRGILEEGEFREHAKPHTPKKAKSVPVNAPGFLLSPPVVQAFNNLYFRRVPIGGRRHDRTLQDFFFPLDRIQNWNRLYGKPGFHQFQCVLPEASARDGLRRMMQLVATARLSSPLAVLKRLGVGRGGMLSFPMAGYTLAIDFPNRTKTAGLLAELEDITLDAGGRVYFAKDALMRRGSVAQMYDELPEFARIANAADPEHVFETNLVRRLNLRGSK